MNIKNLKIAASFAEGAYTEEFPKFYRVTKISSWLSSTCFYCEGYERDVIVHKGSKEILDWILNFAVLPVPYCGSWVHFGFSWTHRSVFKKILKKIKKRDQEKPLLITGHSAGGCAAELTALRLQREGFGGRDSQGSYFSLITFGKASTFLKPRKRRLKIHPRDHFSVCSGSDIVVRTPRYCFAPDQNQTLFYLGNDGCNYVNPDRDWMKQDFKLGQIISDHSMQNYVCRLNDFFDGAPG